MKIATFDLETIPNQSLPESAIPKFDPASVKPLKSEAATSAKIEKEKVKFDLGLIKKMSVNPDLCEVITFVGSIYDTETGVSDNVTVSHEPMAVKAAWEFVNDAYHSSIPIVTWNGNFFDLRVLWHRAMELRIPISRRILNDFTRKYSTKHHYDLKCILTDWDYHDYTPMDFFLKRYGFTPKTADGSMVYTWWQMDRIDKIEEYCLNDVLSTSKLFQYCEPWIVEGVSVED